jgi:hypothetical protein
MDLFMLELGLVIVISTTFPIYYIFKLIYYTIKTFNIEQNLSIIKPNLFNLILN